MMYLDENIEWITIIWWIKKMEFFL